MSDYECRAHQCRRQAIELRTRAEAAERERDEAAAMLAACYRMAGADCDGDEDWRIAPRALQAVTDLRRDYDEAGDEAEALRRRVAELEAVLRHIRNHSSVTSEQIAVIDALLRGEGRLADAWEKWATSYEASTGDPLQVDLIDRARELRNLLGGTVEEKS
jgi:hypothetical protein